MDGRSVVGLDLTETGKGKVQRKYRKTRFEFTEKRRGKHGVEKTLCSNR